MKKIAVDAMGGDNAPQALVEGVNQAIRDFDDIEVDDYKCNSSQQLSQHYQSIMENHCCADLLAMTKSIYVKSMIAGRNKKHLGQIDKRYMKRAEDLIYSEIAVALDTNREDVERYIKDKLGKYII